MTLAALKWQAIERDVSDGWDEITSRKQTFWKVSILGRVLSDRARPFSASDSEIVLHECAQCGQCGLPNIWARTVGDTVVWINAAAPVVNDPALHPDEMLVFEADQYLNSLSSGSSGLPPLLTNEELSLFARCIRFPAPDSALYRIPESPVDPLGRRAVEAVHHALLSDIASLTLVDAPESPIQELLVGCQLEDFVQSQWRFGLSSGRYAIFLRSYPSFQVWLTSPVLQNAFRLCC